MALLTQNEADNQGKNTMNTYKMTEKENFNSERKGEFFEAKTLTAAKVKASKMQCFEGTIIELENEQGETVAVKEKSGKWIEQVFFEA